MKELKHLSEVYKNYDTFVIDLWGVMHNGVILNSKAVEAIDQLKNNSKKVVFLSNAPRPSSKVVNFLLKMNLDKKTIFFELLFRKSTASIAFEFNFMPLCITPHKSITNVS